MSWPNFQWNDTGWDIVNYFPNTQFPSDIYKPVPAGESGSLINYAQTTGLVV